MIAAISVIVFLTVLYFLVRYWDNKSKQEIGRDIEDLSMYKKYKYDDLDEWEKKIS